jgi:hypothetical protein
MQHVHVTDDVQDHGAWIVPHGIQNEVSESPMVHCIISMGQRVKC